MDGLALSSIQPRAPSSSEMVVVTDDLPSRGAGPPPPEGLETVTVKVSPGSSTVSSMVLTVKVCGPAAVRMNVSVPVLAV